MDNDEHSEIDDIAYCGINFVEPMLIDFPPIIGIILSNAYDDFSPFFDVIPTYNWNIVNAISIRIKSGCSALSVSEAFDILEYFEGSANLFDTDDIQTDLLNDKFGCYQTLYDWYKGNRMSDDALHCEHFILTHFLKTHSELIAIGIDSLLAA
jgi:hypothetical protein